MNHFCQLCGHYIMLLGLMSLGSVDKVSKHSCQVLFYEKAATSDMILLGLELVRTTTECQLPTSAKIPLLVVDQTL